MGTVLDSTKVLEFANNALWVALPGTTLPTGPFPTAKPAGWSILGRVTSDGFTGAQEVNNSKEYDSVGALAFQGWSELNQTVSFTAMETNEVTEALKSPGAAKTVGTAGTSEVQTLTVTGTPTGGSLVLGFAGATTSVAYNAAPSAVQTALRAIGATAVVVTGSAGGPYTFTFPASSGDVAQVTVDGSGLTGGTSPSASVATTTPGVRPVYQWLESSTSLTSPPLLWFALDEVHVPTGAASCLLFAGRITPTDLGATTKGASKKTAFQVSKEEDPTIGGLNRRLSTIPAHAPSLSPGF